jgi:S1 RNA binding domain protein
MDFEIGAIVPGKVNGITKFGAFVTIAPGVSGLVHISEISNTFVNDVSEHLSEGQDVTVKIIGLDQSGRMNLSIKAAAVPAEPVYIPAQPETPTLVAEPTFEDRLKRFIQDSNKKISDLKKNTNKKGARRRSR